MEDKTKKRGQDKTLEDMTLKDVVSRIFTQLDDLQDELKFIKFPKGARDNPARTCKDIYLAHPEFKDGLCTNLILEAKCLDFP